VLRDVHARAEGNELQARMSARVPRGLTAAPGIRCMLHFFCVTTGKGDGERQRTSVLTPNCG